MAGPKGVEVNNTLYCGFVYSSYTECLTLCLVLCVIQGEEGGKGDPGPFELVEPNPEDCIKGDKVKLLTSFAGGGAVKLYINLKPVDHSLCIIVLNCVLCISS